MQGYAPLVERIPRNAHLRHNGEYGTTFFSLNPNDKKIACLAMCNLQRKGNIRADLMSEGKVALRNHYSLYSYYPQRQVPLVGDVVDVDAFLEMIVRDFEES